MDRWWCTALPGAGAGAGGHIIVQEMKLNYWQIVIALPRCIAAPASTNIISIEEGKHVPTFFATRGTKNV